MTWWRSIHRWSGPAGESETGKNSSVRQTSLDRSQLAQSLDGLPKNPVRELSGQDIHQVHGVLKTVLYRNPTLVHNPKIALEKQTEKQLLAALPKKKVEAPKPAPAKPISTPLP